MLSALPVTLGRHLIELQRIISMTVSSVQTKCYFWRGNRHVPRHLLQSGLKHLRLLGMVATLSGASIAGFELEAVGAALLCLTG